MAAFVFNLFNKFGVSINITLYTHNTAHPSLVMGNLVIIDNMEADQTQIDWTSNGFITGNIGTSPEFFM
jgi:hypothetical protein